MARKPPTKATPVEYAELVPVVAPPATSRVPTPAARHRGRLEARDRKPSPTVELCAELIHRMQHGEIPSEICDDAHMPAIGRMRRFVAELPERARAYDAAMAACCDCIVEEARQFLRDSTETGNVDQMRIADIYCKSALSLVASMSPRTHGTLVKLAGADAGPIAVSVINYAMAKTND